MQIHTQKKHNNIETDVVKIKFKWRNDLNTIRAYPQIEEINNYVDHNMATFRCL